MVIGSPSQEQGDICVSLKEHAVNRRFKIALNDEETTDDVSLCTRFGPSAQHNCLESFVFTACS